MAWKYFDSSPPPPPPPSPSSQAISIEGGVGDNNTIVNVNSSFTEEQIDRLSTDFKTSLQGVVNPQTTDLLFNNLLQEIEEKKGTIVDLQELVKNQAQRIKEFESDEDVSNETKLLVKQGRVADAERLIDKALIEHQKRSAQTYYEHGKIKELALKYQDAFASFQEAVKLQPTNAKYLNQAGELAY